MAGRDVALPELLWTANRERESAASAAPPVLQEDRGFSRGGRNSPSSAELRGWCEKSLPWQVIGRELVRKGCRLAVRAVRRCESDDVGSERLFGRTILKNRRTRSPSLARVLQFFLVVSTPVRVQYPNSIAG